MTDPGTQILVDRLRRDRRSNALGLVALSLLIMLLVAGGVYLYTQLHHTSAEIRQRRVAEVVTRARISHLASALNAQRQQFLTCRHRSDQAAGCRQPTSLPAGQVGPQGVQGLQGVPGIPGLRGVPGPPGPEGLRGVPGPLGPTGRPGPQGQTGVQGQTGTQGLAGLMGAVGPAGPAGSQGPKGDTGDTGPPGPKGDTGAQGPQGQSAFPFTFTFTVKNNPIQSTTYTVTCTAAGCTVSSTSNP